MPEGKFQIWNINLAQVHYKVCAAIILQFTTQWHDVVFSNDPSTSQNMSHASEIVFRRLWNIKQLSQHILIKGKYSKTKHGTHGFSMNTTEQYKDQISKVSRQSWRREAGETYSFPTGNKTRWRTGHSKIN